MNKKRIAWAIVGYVALFFLFTYMSFVFDWALQGL